MTGRYWKMPTHSRLHRLKRVWRYLDTYNKRKTIKIVIWRHKCARVACCNLLWHRYIMTGRYWKTQEHHILKTGWRQWSVQEAKTLAYRLTYDENQPLYWESPKRSRPHLLKTGWMHTSKKNTKKTTTKSNPPPPQKKKNGGGGGEGREKRKKKRTKIVI